MINFVSAEITKKYIENMNRYHKMITKIKGNKLVAFVLERPKWCSG
jgi:hypothetical protein